MLALEILHSAQLADCCWIERLALEHRSVALDASAASGKRSQEVRRTKAFAAILVQVQGRLDAEVWYCFVAECVCAGAGIDFAGMEKLESLHRIGEAHSETVVVHSGIVVEDHFAIEVDHYETGVEAHSEIAVVHFEIVAARSGTEAEGSGTAAGHSEIVAGVRSENL